MEGGDLKRSKGGGAGTTIPIYFIQGLSFSHLEITLQSYHQLQDAAISAVNIWCILQVMMTLLYVETYVWRSASVTMPMSGASAADDDFVKLLYSLQNCVVHLKKKNFLLPP